MITRQQLRGALAEGGRLLDPAGRLVGRITDVVLGVRTSQPAWATVDCSLSTGEEAVVPLARARLLDGGLQVPYTAADVLGAPRRDANAGHLDEAPAEELRRYYAALDDALPGAHPVQADLDALPVVAGLDVRAGDDIAAAYPVRSSGPWPPVTSSSPGPPWWERHQWRWPSVVTSVRAMRLELRPVLELTGLSDDELDDLVLAAGEAASNAVEHARSPSLPFFDVCTEVGDGRVRIVIQDHGRWRAPTPAGDRGRGLQLIGLLADATLTVGAAGTTVLLCSRPGSFS